MSIRYSGDTEIQIKYNRRLGEWVGTVKDPFLRFDVIVPNPGTDPKARDSASRQLLARAMRWARTRKRTFLLDRTGTRIRLRRVYQAPCPLE